MGAVISGEVENDSKRLNGVTFSDRGIKLLRKKKVYINKNDDFIMTLLDVLSYGTCLFDLYVLFYFHMISVHHVI